MSDTIITGMKSPAPRCDRCRNFTGVPDNFMGVCDRCKFIILSLTELPDHAEWVAAFAASDAAQVQKYRAK